MNLLYFIDSLSSGGKERRLIELMKGLKAYPQIKFELVVMNNDIHYKDVFKLDIKIHYLLRKSKKDLTVFKKFYSICNNSKVDIVHCWDSMTAVISVPSCKLLNIKLINGMVVDTPVNRNIFNKDWFRARLTFPFSNVVIGNSKAGLLAYGSPMKKSICIYNGMDFNRFKDLKEASSIRKEIIRDELQTAFIVGMVAAFEERKDYRTLIKAATNLISLNRNVIFILIGDGKDFNEIRNSIPSSIIDKIIFLGKISEIESIVNIFDLGVLLTNSKVHGEGISNSIIEYMALGKPVIATRGGGTDEVVINNMNGYLIDAFNNEQLEERLETLINNKSLLIDLGSKGRQMAQERFDHKIMTNQYLKIYKKLIEEN